MSRKIAWYIISFIGIVLVQVLILNNIQFSGYINPYFYILFVLILPIGVPRYLLLLLGFLLGITVDVFCSTPGIHASATVLISFLRPYFFSTSNLDEQEKAMLPTIKNMGLGWFLRYVAVLILIHHVFLFYIEAFTFVGFLHTLVRSLFSSIFTFVVVIISQFLIFRK